MKKNSPYADTNILLITQHDKKFAIAESFKKILDAEVHEFHFNTDEFGTFSGEVERQGTAIECAKKKCDVAFSLNSTPDLCAIASEGSFGPHPLLPFQACDHEILFFKDRQRDFHLHLGTMSSQTNFRKESVTSIESLMAFANDVHFPSHRLIIRPDGPEVKNHIIKGIASYEELESAFFDSLKISDSQRVWVETDMRANHNPMRMEVIQALAQALATRLATACPECKTPGFGKVRVETGLPCSLCGVETTLIRHEIWGCCRCPFEIISPNKQVNEFADPRYCDFCNP